ncbi:MAG: phosphomannose isomerase type II C-terminal cupin domain [Bacillota bacterium]
MFQHRLVTSYSEVRREPPEILVVYKPWGKFTQYVINEPVTVKILEVRAGESLSLQSHHLRSELWVPLDEGARVEKDGIVFSPPAMRGIFIPPGCRHRLLGDGKDCRVLEVSFGFFDENDIVRYEDRYGRPSISISRNQHTT